MSALSLPALFNRVLNGTTKLTELPTMEDETQVTPLLPSQLDAGLTISYRNWLQNVCGISGTSILG